MVVFVITDKERVSCFTEQDVLDALDRFGLFVAVRIETFSERFSRWLSFWWPPSRRDLWAYCRRVVRRVEGAAP